MWFVSCFLQKKNQIIFRQLSELISILKEVKSRLEAEQS